MPPRKMLLVIACWLISSANLKAQSTLSGMVTDSLNAPIAYASVYLSQTTYGTITNEKGNYSLTVPSAGTYELIASCLGYKSLSQNLKLNGENRQMDIRLTERPIHLKEVTVKEKDKNRPQNYELFLKCFMGKSIYKPYCTIENSKDLIVYRDSEGKNLIAYSKKPLAITNSALGYKIIYDLKYFKYELSDERLRFLGDYYFVDISNQKRANSRTNRNRLIAYYGSRMHFLRALFADSLQQENFEICNIEPDSCGNKVLTHSMKAKEMRLAVSADSVGLYHYYPVMITYTNNHPELYPLPYIFKETSYTSGMRLNDTVQVYKNGNYSMWYNISWLGSMSDVRIAEMLPYDFVPKPWGRKD